MRRPPGSTPRAVPVGCKPNGEIVHIEGAALTLDERQAVAPSIREPRCVHPGGGAASACTICRDDPPLRKWKQDWLAWLEENPGSEEARNGYARWVRDR